MVTPFTVRVADEVLDDLRARLARTVWPQELDGRGWGHGTPRAFVERVCERWAAFDWRAWEAGLNALPQVRVVVDGVGLHAVHVKNGGVPLLLTNGWPSSVFEYVEVVPKLVAAGFDVVAPALPGYGFSDAPTRPGTNATRIAELFAKLMTELGYGRFLAHGSDMGAGVVEQLRQRHAGRLHGAHTSNVFWGHHLDGVPSAEEAAYLKRVAEWQMKEGAYALVHATKPQTLAHALADSPAGLAAWVGEKFEAWTDGGVEASVGLDALCANLTVYWATGTVASSVRMYAEAAADEGAKTTVKNGVPCGVAVYPRDILPAPRAWGERWLNVARWHEAPRGGHFPAWEVPDLFADDLAAFARGLALL